MMQKLLFVLVFAVVATLVCSNDLDQGSLHSHHRLIKRLSPDSDSSIVSLNKRKEPCNSKNEWKSSGSWSHSKDKKEEEHQPVALYHHHHHHRHGLHHHHHHHHHHSAEKQAKETSATATSPEQHKVDQETSKQNQDKHTSKSGGGGGGGGAGGGLLDITFDGKCPHPKATEKYPNGCIEFLNCNIDHGWSPAHVKIEHLKIVSADEVVKGDVFKPCAKYLGFFKSIAKEFNIHATVLMSIAMQESHCDAGLKGPNGEISLMQIIPANCRGNCWDVYNNIRLGAIELDSHLKHHGGNFLLAAGEYNGWENGMTTAEAKNEQWGPCAQRNLDYLHQLVNGWLQGKDGYTKEFTVYNNLASCNSE